MLKKIFQSKEDRIKEKIQEHFKEGMSLLSEKFFNQAMIEFDKAMILNPEAVYPRLVSELETAAGSGELESALAIGLNLMKENETDFELANKLGNYARELKEYKQAEGLYKTSLKIKKNYETAFYNLAATTAKVDIFDEAVKSSLSIFDDVVGFVLPEYQDNPEIITELEKTILEGKKETTEERIGVLSDERKQKLEVGHAVEASELAMEIKELKDNMSVMLPEDVFGALHKISKESLDKEKPYKYNMVLYALSKNKPKWALKALAALSATDYDTIDMLQAIALFQKKKVDDATGMLIRLLGENEFNRYCNVNLGLMYRKAGKHFFSRQILNKDRQFTG